MHSEAQRWWERASITGRFWKSARPPSGELGDRERWWRKTGRVIDCDAIRRSSVRAPGSPWSPSSSTKCSPHHTGSSEVGEARSTAGTLGICLSEPTRGRGTRMALRSEGMQSWAQRNAGNRFYEVIAKTPWWRARSILHEVKHARNEVAGGACAMLA